MHSCATPGLKLTRARSESIRQCLLLGAQLRLSLLDVVHLTAGRGVLDGSRSLDDDVVESMRAVGPGSMSGMMLPSSGFAMAHQIQGFHLPHAHARRRKRERESKK